MQIAEVRFDNNGAVVALKAEGFDELLAIAIGPAEAFALYRTFGPETRRPSTLLTWQHSLDVSLGNSLNFELNYPRNTVMHRACIVDKLIVCSTYGSASL